MERYSIKFKTVADYLDSLDPGKKRVLKELRKTILQAAPEAEEVISYNMPALRLNGMLVYYAAFKEHISFFPGSAALLTFSNDLVKYEQSKGTIRFPLDRKLPSGLISRIVKFRVRENKQKALLKGKKK